MSIQSESVGIDSKISAANAQLEAMRKKWQEDFEARCGKRDEREHPEMWDAMLAAWCAAAAHYHNSGR